MKACKRPFQCICMVLHSSNECCGGVCAACPVHMSSVEAFASALAASLCVAMDGSMAFCFVRDVETEQLLGVYAARPAVSCVQHAWPAAKGRDDHALSQPGCALSKQQTVKSFCPKRDSTLQSCLNALTTEARKDVCFPLLSVVNSRQLPTIETCPHGQ